MRPRRAGVRRRAALDQGNNKGPPSPGPMTVPVVRSKGPSESTAWKGRHGRHDEGLKHDLRDGLASCHLRVQSWCRGLADVDPGQSRAASRLRPRRTPNEFARPCGQGSPVDPGGLRSRGTLASRGPQVGPGTRARGHRLTPAQQRPPRTRARRRATRRSRKAHTSMPARRPRGRSAQPGDSNLADTHSLATSSQVLSFPRGWFRRVRRA